MWQYQQKILSFTFVTAIWVACINSNSHLLFYESCEIECQKAVKCNPKPVCKANHLHFLQPEFNFSQVHCFTVFCTTPNLERVKFSPTSQNSKIFDWGCRCDSCGEVAANFNQIRCQIKCTWETASRFIAGLPHIVCVKCLCLWVVNWFVHVI